MGYKNYEKWPCIKCGKLIKVYKPIHQMPPQVKCDKCMEKENKNEKIQLA
jgi:hypothetical protein